MDMAMGA